MYFTHLSRYITKYSRLTSQGLKTPVFYGDFYKKAKNNIKDVKNYVFQASLSSKNKDDTYTNLQVICYADGKLTYLEKVRQRHKISVNGVMTFEVETKEAETQDGQNLILKPILSNPTLIIRSFNFYETDKNDDSGNWNDDNI